MLAKGVSILTNKEVEHMLNIDENNRRILLLKGVPFFEFKKTGKYQIDLFLSFEAERFCFLFNEAISETTSSLIKKSLVSKHSYTLFHGSLHYAPFNMLIGEFLNTESRNYIGRTRFLCVLNTKTNFFSTIPESWK